jgi:hypothetical protein
MKLQKSDLVLVALALFVVGVSVLVSGCSMAPPKPVAPDLPATVAAKQSVTIDEQLIAPCTPMASLDTRPYSESDTLDPISAWANAYTDCSGRFARYVQLTSKLLNINVKAGAQIPAKDAPATSK